MQSLWSKTTELTKWETFKEEEQKNIHIENVVIGAGITGILTAYFLQQKGQEVIVLEAEGIASGQTKNTTAKITSQHGLIYADMIKRTGNARAKGYAMANEEAIKKYEELIKKEKILCHFKKLPSFLYTTKEEETDKFSGMYYGIDIAESVVGLTKGFFGKKERRCRHMGCGLVWNEEEKSWDCPCHGSRFDKKGNLIDNPAQKNLYRKR